MKWNVSLQLKALCVIAIGLVVISEPATAKDDSGLFACYICSEYIMCPSEAELKAFCMGAGCPFSYPGCSDEGVPNCPTNAMIGCNSGP